MRGPNKGLSGIFVKTGRSLHIDWQRNQAKSLVNGKVRELLTECSDASAWGWHLGIPRKGSAVEIQRWVEITTGAHLSRCYLSVNNRQVDSSSPIEWISIEPLRWVGVTIRAAMSG